MTEEKQSKVDKIIEKKPKLWMTMAKAIVIGLFIVLIITSIIVGLLQFTTFDERQNFQSPATYLESKKRDLSYTEDGFVVGIPEDVIAYELNRLMKDSLETTDLNLESITYSGRDKKVNMDLTYFGFYLPVSYTIDWTKDDEVITGNLSSMKISKLGWSLPTFMIQGIESLIDLERIKEQQLFIRNYDIQDDLSLVGMEIVEDVMVLSFKVDEVAISNEVKKLREAINPDLLDYYKTYSPERTEVVIKILEQIYPLEHEQIEHLVNDLRGNKHIINDLILLTEGYDTSGLLAMLEGYNITINETTINMERKAFKGQAIDPLIAMVFGALDDYFVEKILAFNQGKPYDLEAMNTLTIKELVDIYELDIEPSIVDEMTFIYDEAFKVAYRIDDETYYIRSINAYEVVRADQYETLMGAHDFVKPDYVTDSELWDKVTAFIKTYFEVEEVFVRYMKSDGQSTFAVISTSANPQDYWSMAIYDNGTMEVLDENVKVVASLITNHPEFNVETATREIENISFERIPDSTHDTIIDELYDIGVISSKSATEIIYSSYDGSKYIAFKLNNDKEYVFKVEGTTYGTYLATVYNKDRAISNWKDMSELLLLQEKPE